MLIFIPPALRTQALLHLDSKSLGQIIQSFSQKDQLNRAKELHALLIRFRFSLCTSTTNHFINLYSKCGVLVYAQYLFDKMPTRNIVSWTSMITAFSQNLKHSEALRAFSLMRAASESPTQFAFASAVRASVSLHSIEVGKQLHCLALKSGLSSDIFVGSNLSDMYSRCGDIVDACKFFDEIPNKDVVLWTSMIDGYSKSGEFESALEAFKRMRGDGVAIDSHVLSTALSACASTVAHKFGKCLQSSAVKLGFDSELVIIDTLVNMYLKSGDTESASKVLMILSKHESNVISFSYIIRRYCEIGIVSEAFDLFLWLRRQGIEPKESTFSSLIKACANRDSLEQGVQMHAQVIKHNLSTNSHVCSCLVEMYGKSGLLDHSTRVFDKIRNLSETAWNSFMKDEDGIGIFENLVLLLKPSGRTSTNLLILCSSVGLVDEGLNYFRSMEERFGLFPTEEHYNQVVDLLSGAGRVDEAEEFIKNMPVKANAFGLTSYLRACEAHGDVEKIKLAAGDLISLEPNNVEALVMLSNVYAKEERWKELRVLKKKLRNITTDVSQG